ncbi:MAG: polysaccharide deacetylase family protein [Chloroflexota bacterium]|nr:polysaccharide deacetylase family protein [Chloroflexota bacterium]
MIHANRRTGERVLLASTLLGTGLILVLTATLFVSGLRHFRGDEAARVAAPPSAPSPTAAASPAPIVAATATARGATMPPGDDPAPLAGSSPTPRLVPSASPNLTASQVLEYGPSDRREVALTFDAGADRGYGAEILDLLAEEGVKASFGMTGLYAEANPDLVRRMVEEGHMLFNHTWSHPSFTGRSSDTAPLTRAERLEELRTTEDLVRELTGYELRPYFRPPYGDFDASVLADLADAGYGVTVHWSCDSRDSLGATADEILTRCVEGARSGRIILLHLGGQSAAYEALPRMIASLRAQGFAFVTVEEMLRP